MLDLIKDIENALRNKSYLSALALSLTLPDICGGVEYPQFKRKNGSRLGRKQYETWFNDWVNQYYADHTGWTNNYSEAKNPYFTGEMCYDLRCSFLHAGNSDIKKWGENEDDDEHLYCYEFNLAINGADSFGSSWSSSVCNNGKIIKTKSVTINIDKLCEYICLAAKTYYKEKDASDFEKHNIDLIDFNRNLQQ
ncbi:hypothetical protein [Bacillus safensis]|uniref:hypothetical protein n=2 Tax=Bacillus safensis TaxID=561879 RepID=UPI0005972FD3|nr:hypothetical protein [Bacillus safensis]KIL13764.1 hypothetical protein B4129_0599 [Bacillus safensis]MBW4850696.1 hypothetical protein [Bacillaceae bacterium]MBW4852750.1 hypothetical protein [Bacillaceae bacterium]MBW4855210.1 hypothetical protein [Bacillaceae bacterium]